MNSPSVIIKLLFITCLLSTATYAQSKFGAFPLANTYSIVAYDEATGEMGVAVQSHWFSVGSIVTWAEAGIGAIATQSFVNPQFGPDGLALLKAGLSAKEVVEKLIAEDEGRAVRQLAIVDAKGGTAAYTGEKCLAAAGQIIGDGYSVQANMMDKATVWPAMEKAYLAAEGPLEDRLMAALTAAENEGGDVRGKQSAAILVVKKNNTGKVWEDRKVDLRIEDHPTPIKEMERLLRINKAYAHMNQGDLDMEHNDFDAALKSYSAAEKLYSENPEMSFWTAVSLCNNKNFTEAFTRFEKVFEANSNWKKLVERIYPDLLKVDKDIYDKILKL